MTDKSIEKEQKAKNIVGGGTSRRIGYIDALKGFGIICVVLGHVAGGYRTAGTFPDAEWLLKAIYNITYCFHMPFFFILSGFVFFRSYFDENLKPKISKLKWQILNLVVVYAFFSIVYGIFRMIFAKYSNGETNISDILMIWAKPIAEYWYLYTLIFLYLIFMIPGIVKQKILILIPSALLICILSIYVNVWSLGSIMYYTLYFCVGILISRGEKLFESKIFTAVISLTSIALMTIYKGDIEGFKDVQIIKIAVALGISLGIIFLFKQIPILGENPFLKLCGLHCLEIYIIHGFFTSGNRTILRLLGITEPYTSILLNFIISLLVPFAIVWIFKKIKIYDLFFRPIYFFKSKRIRN